MLLTTVTTLLLALSASANPTASRRAQPQTISLQSRQIPTGQSNLRRALSAINAPLTDYFNGTDLQ